MKELDRKTRRFFQLRSADRVSGNK